MHGIGIIFWQMCSSALDYLFMSVFSGHVYNLKVSSRRRQKTSPVLKLHL